MHAESSSVTRAASGSHGKRQRIRGGGMASGGADGSAAGHDRCERFEIQAIPLRKYVDLDVRQCHRRRAVTSAALVWAALPSKTMTIPFPRTVSFRLGAISI